MRGQNPPNMYIPSGLAQQQNMDIHEQMHRMSLQGGQHAPSFGQPASNSMEYSQMLQNQIVANESSLQRIEMSNSSAQLLNQPSMVGQGGLPSSYLAAYGMPGADNSFMNVGPMVPPSGSHMPLFCSLHGKHLDFFCIDCQQRICGLCLGPG